MNNSIDRHTFKHLLATTTREKEDSYVVNELFTRFPSIQELLDVTLEELLQIKGIGVVKAEQIIAALQLARMNPTPVEQRFTIRSPEDVYDYLKDMQYLKQEHFIVLGLNTKNQIVFRETVFVGSLNSSIVHPREVFNHLVRRSCASAIVSHNHPSGDPSPSMEDITVSERLADAGTIMKINILDHVIIGHGKFTSLKEKGYL